MKQIYTSRNWGRLLFGAAVSLCLSACGTFKPAKDETVYYRLTAQLLDQASGSALAQVSPRSIVDLNFPEDVHINKLMVVDGANTVRLIDSARWIEAFDQSFERALDLNVRAALGIDGHGMSLSVEVLSFTANDREIICKYAYSSIAEPKVSGVSEVRQSLNGDSSLENVVAAIDIVNAQMAAQIVGAVRLHM